MYCLCHFLGHRKLIKQQLHLQHRSATKISLPFLPPVGCSCFSRPNQPTYPPDPETGGLVLVKVFVLLCVENYCNLVFMGSHEQSAGAEVVTIDVKAAKSLLDSGYAYLEVRTVDEYKKGHVDTHKIINVPYMFNTPEGRVKNPEFLMEVSKVCKEDDHIVVGCQSGVRSFYATADLLGAGYKDVSNMGGGYLAWLENGFPVKVELEEEKKG